MLGTPGHTVPFPPANAGRLFGAPRSLEFPMHDIVAEVTARIARRSRDRRAVYRAAEAGASVLF